MVIKQLSVFIENKSGKLSEITQILKKSNIDIRALSLADTTNFGILRLIVNDPVAAKSALREAGFTVSLTDVIAVGIEDKPGGLANALQILSDVKIDVEYMYAFISRETKQAYVILRVEDNEKAADILSKQGIIILEEKDIYDM